MDASEEFREQVQKLLASCGQLRILVFGNVGSGKSTLINTLLGCEVAAVGSSLCCVTHEVLPFKRCATENIDDILVTSEKVLKGVIVTLWDSPGFQEVFMTDSKKKALLSEIKTKCADVDLVIYCTSMTTIRWSRGDEDTISDLAKALGKDKWDRSIFALTFANHLSVPASESCTLAEYFVKKRDDLCDKLRHSLAETKIEGEVPIFPVGHDTGMPLAVPSEKGWYSDFWIGCCKRASVTGFIGLVKIIDVQIRDAKYVANLLVLRLHHLEIDDPTLQVPHFRINEFIKEHQARVVEIVSEEIGKHKLKIVDNILA